MLRKRTRLNRLRHRNAKTARRIANAKGIPLRLVNGWNCSHMVDDEGFTPFGIDRKKDNIYQNMPQVALHGMDEGLTLKLCVGLLESAILEAYETRGTPATEVKSYTAPLMHAKCTLHSTSPSPSTCILNTLKCASHTTWNVPCVARL